MSDPTHARSNSPLTLTREQVRRVDRLAIEQLGIPGVVLMENAGRNATHALLEHLRQCRGIAPEGIRAAVLCGGGNNGGDGYVIARHLHNHGAHVAIQALKAPEELSGDAALNALICRRMGLPFETTTDPAAVSDRLGRVNVVVDALLGTGFTGEVREPMAAVIAAVNALPRGEAGATVLAVDVPSGLDCDTGGVENAAVWAELTVTFVAAKPGLLGAAGRGYVGELVVADIGAPPELIDQVMGHAG